MCANTQIARMIECIYMTFLGVSPHAVGEAFYTGELEHEIREVGLVDFRFKRDSDREKCMESVVKAFGICERCQSFEVF